MHEKVQCQLAHSHYKGRSTAQGGAWIDLYRCLICGREGKFIANFLGKRVIWCDGRKFTKELPKVVSKVQNLL